MLSKEIFCNTQVLLAVKMISSFSVSKNLQFRLGYNLLAEYILQKGAEFHTNIPQMNKTKIYNLNIIAI
jgi:hypothetical protein